MCKIWSVITGKLFLEQINRRKQKRNNCQARDVVLQQRIVSLLYFHFFGKIACYQFDQNGSMPSYSSKNPLSPTERTYDIAVAVAAESLKIHIYALNCSTSRLEKAFAHSSKNENPHEGNNERENKKNKSKMWETHTNSSYYLQQDLHI